jgi:7,8-dihydroneopterin aldolase/epimerase/oxygenase
MRGTVAVRNLEFQANHGASAAERKSARRFQVDVDLSFSVERVLRTDRLSDTVDYHEVCRLLVEIGEGGPYRLLESLAGKMLGTLRARYPEASISLELRKLHPPCPGNPSHTSIRVQADAEQAGR